MTAPPDQLDAGFDDGLLEADLSVIDSALDVLLDDQRFNLLREIYWDVADQFCAEHNPSGRAPYGWQQAFHAAGLDCDRRGLIAANQVGKTRTAAAEVAMHLTGIYPPWWTGKRWDRPIVAACATNTNQSCRDITMAELLGPEATVDFSKMGTGMIPRDCIDLSSISMRSANIKGVVDSLRIKHAGPGGAGGYSVLYFRSYEQEREKFQGVKWDLCWLDEQPPEEIAGECEMRLIAKRGLMIATFTPLEGRTGYVARFLAGGEGIYTVQVGWDDAPHLDEAVKRKALAMMLPHEIDARTKGIPTVGSGLVFAGLDLHALVDPSILAQPWHRQIVGIDFGFDHPAASVHLAVDERGGVLVLDAQKESRMTAVEHVRRIGAMAPGVPVAWPHDGLQREKSSGVPLMKRYRSAGANMLGVSARYEDAKGGAQDIGPWVLDVFERARQGAIRIHPRALPVLEREIAGWHYDKHGKIVAENDDAISALRYGMMMLRYARLPVSASDAACVKIVNRPNAGVELAGKRGVKIRAVSRRDERWSA